MAVETVEVYPSGYIESGTMASISNIANAYTPANSSTYATFGVKKNTSNPTAYIYLTFDLSVIPVNATICNVSCTVKGRLSVAMSGGYRLYSGTTAKGTSANIPTSTTDPSAMTVPIDCGAWTREELNDIRLRISAQALTTYSVYFYGATLTVEYETSGGVKGTVTIGSAAKELVGGYVNIGGTWKEIVKQYTNVGGVWKE